MDQCCQIKSYSFFLFDANVCAPYPIKINQEVVYLARKTARKLVSWLVIFSLCFSLFGLSGGASASDTDYTVTYTSSTATAVTLHWTTNNWTNTVDTAMARNGTTFTANINVPEGATLIYCYHITAPTDYWDSNGGKNWTVTIPVTGKYEAENAGLSGGAKVNTNHAGYSGTGFLDGYTAPEQLQLSASRLPVRPPIIPLSAMRMQRAAPKTSPFMSME